MDYPKIGDRIDIDWALGLCQHFKLDYLVRRIESDNTPYMAWEFDGCSCIHDRFLGFITGLNADDITYKCCLPHDLGYAYGEPGNRMERKRVDLKFLSDLVTKAKMQDWMASAIYEGVRVGGSEVFGLPFSWAFARKA